MRDAKEAAELMRSRRFEVEGKNEADRKRQCHSTTVADPKPPCRRVVSEHPAEKYRGRSNGGAGPELEEESDLELTLATGGSRIRRKAKETSFTSDSGSSFSSCSHESEMVKFDGRNRGSFQVSDASMTRLRHDVEGSLRQDGGLKQPPWLLQHLSLNMTS